MSSYSERVNFSPKVEVHPFAVFMRGLRTFLKILNVSTAHYYTLSETYK
jgi:hypothetical protein